MSRRYLTLGIAAIVIALCIVGVLEYNRQQSLKPVESMFADLEIPNQSTPKNARQDRKAKIIGQIKTPGDLDDAVQRKSKGERLDGSYERNQQRIVNEGYGTFPVIDLSKTNAHKENLLKALKNPEDNSGTISIVGKREKFDLAHYNQDPTYYLDKTEPGRVFDAAQAKEGVKRIERVGSSTIRTTQNQSIYLTAKGVIGMPISFTAFDGGHFQNGLNAITLKANANSIVVVEYTPTAGVINQVRIGAASPVNSGTAQWTVIVNLPNK